MALWKCVFKGHLFGRDRIVALAPLLRANENRDDDERHEKELDAERLAIKRATKNFRLDGDDCPFLIAPMLE